MTDIDYIIEEGSDGYLIGSVPWLKGCYTQAKSLDELRVRMKEVIELCLEEADEEIDPPHFIGVQRISLVS